MIGKIYSNGEVERAMSGGTEVRSGENTKEIFLPNGTYVTVKTSNETIKSIEIIQLGNRISNSHLILKTGLIYSTDNYVVGQFLSTTIINAINNPANEIVSGKTALQISNRPNGMTIKVTYE